MWYFDEWHDFVRLAAMLVLVFSVYVLIDRYRKLHHNWNPKTVDYWYSMLMWCIAGIAATIQGIALDRPFTPAFVCITAAALVTGRGLNRKGAWGDDKS